VHGRELDRVGVADLASLQPEFLGLSGRQVREERAERRLLSVPRERRRRIGKGVKICACRSRAAPGRAATSTSSPSARSNLGHQLGQRAPDMPAQRPQLSGQRDSRG